MTDVKVNKWRLNNYFDVWGNEKDGYEVNNLCTEAEDLWISEDSTDKEICEFLVQIGFLNTSDMRRIYLEDMGDMIEIYQRKGNYPLGRLEMIA